MSSYPQTVFLLAELDDGLCCFLFLGLSVLTIAWLSNRWGKRHKKCRKCSQLSGAKAKYCSSCGAPFEARNARKFYADLLLRIDNWKKWGWLQAGEHERLRALRERDLEVFEGREIVKLPKEDPAAGEASVLELELVPEVREDESLAPRGFEVVELGDETVLPATDPSPVKPSGVQRSVSRVVDKAVPVTEMRPPRKLSDILQTFMDESNIKIGEFISGLLIIVGSIGLVVTLNVQFQDKVQYLPAAVFLTVVILFHVAGLYSLYRWNLAASSKVVLYIGSLLIPLNMLAATMRDTLPDTQGWMFYLAVLVGAGGFGTMSFYGARALMPTRWWPLMLVVIGPTLMQTVIKLLATGGAVAGIVAVNAVILVPLAMVAIAVLAEHRVLRTSVEAKTADAVSLLRVLTLGIFSLGICVVVLFLKTGELRSWADLCRYLASPFMILSFIVVSAGMLLHRRMEVESQLNYRLVGTWMAIIGCLGAMGAFALAVPDINSMLVVSVIGTLLALIFGRVTRIPFLATTGTIGVGIAAWCVMAKIQVGNVDLLTARELAQFWFDGINSLLLSLAALVCGALHFPFRRSAREADREFARFGFLGVAITAGLGLVVAVVCALLKQGEPGTDCTVIVFSLYAVASLVAAAYLAQKPVIMVATALVPGAWLQAVNTSWFSHWDSQDGVNKFGIAVFGSVVTYVVALIGYWTASQREIGCLRKSEKSYPQLFLTGASFVAYLVAASFTMVEVYAIEGLFQEALIRSTVLIGVMVIVALCYLTDWTWMFVQIQTILTVACAVTLGWWLQNPELGLTADSHVRAQLIALSVGMLFWVGFRKYCQQSAELRGVVVTDLMYADFVLQVIATGVMYLVWLSSLLPPLALIYGPDSVVSGLSATVGHSINYWDWILWIVTLVAWTSVIPDRHRRVSSCCILVVLSALPILASDRLVQIMAADAEAVSHFLRWGYGLLGVLMALIVCTDGLWWKRLVSVLPRFMDNQDEKSTGDKGQQTWAMLRILALLAAALPVVMLTLLQFIHVGGIYLLGAGAQLDVMAGGVAFFENAPSLAFAGPLWLLMLATWIYAMRAAKAGYLLLGFPFWQCGWMVCGLMGIWLDAEVAHFGELVHGFNWFLIGLAIYAAAWSGAHRLVFRGSENPGLGTAEWKVQLLGIGPPARFLFAMSVACLVAYGCIAVIDSFVLAGGLDASDWVQRLGAFADVEAFFAVLVLAGGIFLWPGSDRGPRDETLVVAVFLTLNAMIAHLFVPVIEAGADQVFVTQVLFNQNLGWTMLFLAVLVMIMRQVVTRQAVVGTELPGGDAGPLAKTIWTGFEGRESHWIAVTNLLTILVALGTAVLLQSSSHNDWILIANVGFLAAMFVVLAGLLQQQSSIVWAILLTLLTVGLIDVQLRDTSVQLMAINTSAVVEHLGHFARTQFAALSLVAVALALAVSGATDWLGTKQQDGSRVFRTGSVLVALSICLLLLSSVLGVVAELLGSSERWIDGNREIANLGIPLMALVFFGRYVLFKELLRSLYVWGIALFGTLLAMWMVDNEQGYLYQLNSLQILYTITAYLVLWGLIYHFQDQVVRGLNALGITQARERMERNRLTVSYCQAVAGIAVAVASGAATFFVATELMAHRYLVAFLPLALAFGLQCLKGTPLENERRPLLAVFCLLPILGLLWADLGPSNQASVWLSRIVRFFVATSALSVIASSLSSRVANRWPGWREVSKKIQIGVVMAAGISLAFTLFLEMTSERLAHEMSHIEVAVVCLGLVALGVALLLVALKPDRDPLSLTDTGRQIYVYLSELIILVLALHLWKTRPEWFGAFRDVWPYVLFLIAFIGAFASEYLRRSNIAVLSEPIHNTSFLLPAIPLLALVLFKDEMQGVVADYQWFFFLAALVNVVMAFFRRSFLHAMVAALAGNASLWSVFAGLQNFGFVEHPQFWLIPPAVSVLIAGQLNRKHLDAGQLSFLRYATIGVIYLASSSEMVLKWSLAQQGVQSLAVLAGLSLLGVGVGMLYRIRQFIYLGLGFFLLAMGGSVAKVSSYNQLWFWLALVIFGAIMLVAFAAREKYLPVLRAKLDEMEQWDKVPAEEDKPG